MNPPDIMKNPFLDTLTIELRSNLDFLMRLDTSTNDNVCSFRLRGTSYTDYMNGATFTNYVGAPNHGDLSYENENSVPFIFGPNPAQGSITCAWVPYCHQLYQKYHVLKCIYDITFENTDEVRGNRFSVFMKKYGEQAFPSLDYEYEVDNHNSDIKTLDTNRNAAHNSKSSVTYNGTYQAGDYGEDVINDALHEIWTSVGSQPLYSEGLEFTVRRHRTQAAAVGFQNIYVRMNVKYIVQFKDLKQQFRWFRKGVTKFQEGVNSVDLYGKTPF